ncbi:ATP-dependent DNA ligase [Bacillus sp. MUM 116]|uniref:ATP-dependent DNA ligase n=1 Tax=Bacillus sp. MUM 116 TaxID=1678002 RepID=UPI0008F5F7F0|nr:RNA ligase family protein [Bacillus sp. MUM 116]OIK14214.1 ATP-dependent DNA ligase [Bacillus sp. MUM 116]
MYLSPMLLYKSDDGAFNDPNFISELKCDGFRLIYSYMEQKKLFTRHKTDISQRFPELLALDIPKGTVLDGEVVMMDSNGKIDFEAVIARFAVTNTDRIKILSEMEPVSFVAFDVLVYEGEKVTNLPLYRRKELLNELIPDDTPVLSKVLSIDGNGEALFNLIKQQDLEGIVLKKKDSIYEIGKRSHSWLKIIDYKHASVIVNGYRKEEFGWLLSFEDGKYAGIMELGVPKEARKHIYQQKKIDENEKYVFIEPISVSVKYRNITKAGLLRLPSFVCFNN